ncbi:hypothetical protein RM780_04270 [Streptomyces sp. DSM 44917]|uniref:Uncharacterized protein n=1 Tax=Streptomyces boetiae TaxID=3075541 RepID=A0ABU2L4C9_9ACTN|nr:hypothetical protein [Streptomyces sp. DSM 44917]MDT0306178.1 hypothetical protein [Streptomyces sp. DSM 44917]
MSGPIRAACGPHPIHITPTTLGAKVDVSAWLKRVIRDLVTEDAETLQQIREWDEYATHDATTDMQRAHGRREVDQRIEALAEKHGALMTTVPQAVRIAQALNEAAATHERTAA